MREMGAISEPLSMVVHVAHSTTVGTIHLDMELYFINLQRIASTEKYCWGLLWTVKNLPAMQETWVRSLG